MVQKNPDGHTYAPTYAHTHVCKYTHTPALAGWYIYSLRRTIVPNYFELHPYITEVLVLTNPDGRTHVRKQVTL